MTEPRTLTRQADLTDLVSLLRDQHARKLDVVVPVSKMRAEGGNLVIAGAEAEITEEGVTTVDGTFRPTAVFDDGIADRLGIPPGYLSKLRREHVGLYDQNVNGWLDHVGYADKKYLVRCFRGDDGELGIGRAFLSNSFKLIENIDVLMTVLEGIQAAGVECDIESADLTDRRMYVRIRSEVVAVSALELVHNYRSPFSGRPGTELPMMFAGFEVSNSEVGHGAFAITPRVILQVCSNGATQRIDALRSQHLGGKLEEGTIAWSDQTQQKNLDLIRSMATDAVRKFLSVEYVQTVADRMSAEAGVGVTKPEAVIEHVAKKLRYSEITQNAVLAMFIKGGDLTAGGVMNAVTAAAQEQPDADLAADMEADSMRALSLAAAFTPAS